MKKLVSLLLSAFLLLSALPGCSRRGAPDGDTEYSAGNIAAAVIARMEDPPELFAVDPSAPEFADYAPLYLGELSERVTDGVICYPMGPFATEVAVFQFASAGDALAAREPLEAYRSRRAGTFEGYAPEEAELAKAGQVLVRGEFAAVLICREPDAAAAAFGSCFGPDAPEPMALGGFVVPPPTAGPEPTQPPSEATPPSSEPTESLPASDEYDHDAVVAAWESGDASGLTPKNLEVLNACQRILGEIAAPGMTDYEKELAVNDWMVRYAQYDPAELSSHPVGKPDPDNDNPYGFLLHGVGICLGYSTTFQLFMDLLGIECVTVRGYAYERTEQHAWNMVRLDGDWYCVDVTWNDPVLNGEPSEKVLFYYAHLYFNVTSDYMRLTDHQWRGGVPEAEGTKYAYR